MAQIYSPPAGYEPPDFDASFVDGRFDFDLDRKIHEEYVERLANLARSRRSGDLIGEVVHFSVADGFAVYMIWNTKPLELVHLPIHDGYQLPGAHERGLRLADVRQIVERDRTWKRQADEDDAWWASQPLGSILHYHNGFGQYVRCEVVEGEWSSLDGHQQGRCLQPIALVGNWKAHDLRADAYHAKKVLERNGMWRCSVSCIYEHPSFSGPRGEASTIDPTELDPLLWRQPS